jgi:DNA-binding MarR family transcriptional regulator
MAAVDPAQVNALRLAVVRLDRKLRKAARSGGLTPSQHSALFSLDRHGPFSLGELARREQISKSTVTRLVATLAVKGLVERSADDLDGRSSIVAITPHGRERLAALAEGANDYLHERLVALAPDDLARLFDALGALAQLAERP